MTLSKIPERFVDTHFQPQQEDAYDSPGQRWSACPPEDSGGIRGYEHLLEALRDRRHPEHKELRAWAGKHFDPELFSLQAVNSALAIMQ